MGPVAQHLATFGAAAPRESFSVRSASFTEQADLMERPLTDWLLVVCSGKREKGDVCTQDHGWKLDDVLFERSSAS